jgi:hypothetical protein
METKTELENLQKRLEHLKATRRALEFYKEIKQELLNKLQQSEEWINATNQLAFATEDVAQLESIIRNTALVMYGESMEIPEAITIKQFTVVEIPDEKAAREWCFTNLRKALKFDVKVFEAEAKDKNNDIPAELATVTKEARAQIATKL